MTELAYKALSIVLGVLLVLSVASTQYFRGQVTKTELALQTEKNATTELRGKLELQNTAVDDLIRERDGAQIRYRLAMASADKTSSKASALAAQLAAMRRGGGKSCADAMPIVNKALEGLK